MSKQFDKILNFINQYREEIYGNYTMTTQKYGDEIICQWYDGTVQTIYKHTIITNGKTNEQIADEITDYYNKSNLEIKKAFGIGDVKGCMRLRE